MSISMTLTVNGVKRTIEFDDPRVTLLDLLRERLHLTGTKKGCDRGQGGACTFIVDRRRGPRRPAASGAGGIHRPRRLAVRVLYAWPDHECDWFDPGGAARRRS